jgi:hypothetical protein
MSLQWSGYFAFLVVKSQLDRLVTVSFSGLYLRDGARAGLNDRDGNDVSVFHEYLGHPQLFPEQSKHLLALSLFMRMISPAENLRLAPVRLLPTALRSELDFHVDAGR